MKKIELINLLYEKLKINDYKDYDVSLNGVQVDNSKSEINKVVCAVDASLESIQVAVREKADMLFVHHGIFWGHQYPITDIHYNRISTLIKNDILLFACHLPLDADEKLGNNIQIANRLGLVNIEKFYKYYGVKIGYIGDTCIWLDIKDVVDKLNFTEKEDLKILPFGKTKEIKRIAIVSGGAAGESEINEALLCNADVYITGEHSHSLYHYCKEKGITMITGGHYRSEVFGVKAVSYYLATKGIDSSFVELPTSM